MTTAKSILLAISMFAVAGCEDKPPQPSPQPMTNEEIIQQVKLCEGAGLKPQLLVGIWSNRVMVVQCMIKD